VAAFHNQIVTASNMLKLNFKRLALCGALILGGASAVLAQDSGALLEVLVRKGIISDQEAEDIRADLVRDASQPPAIATGGSNYTTRLRISGRLQAQFAGLDTGIKNAPDNPSTNHFFMRRVYLTARADLGPDWNANITYDFAGSLFDAAWVQWRQSGDLTFDFGLRKVNLGYEERTSSGSLKAIERSGVTRYFVEENNGRRLGGGSYRVGVFMDGKKGNFFYGAAVTNPERAVNFTNAAGTGNGTNNGVALWANAGYNRTFEGGTFLIGAGAGSLPDQGGKTVGTGNDMQVYSVYTDVAYGNFGLAAEYLFSNVERGASATADAKPAGFWIQPTFKISEQLEAVFRYSHLDSDGRGVNVSDGVRSAPSGATHDKLSEMFIGGNWYIKGNDLKFQAGYVYGESEDTVAGLPAEAKVHGVRSQLQLNF
jgi:phosphate-selective porin